MRIRHLQDKLVSDLPNGAALEWFGRYGGESARDPDLVWDFKMYLVNSGKTVAGKTIIDSAISETRFENFMMEQGLRDEEISLIQSMNLRHDYIEANGVTHSVRSLQIKWDILKKAEIPEVVDVFCNLLFESQSSYRMNNTDPNVDPSARYPDILDFHPKELDRKFWRKFHAIDGEIIEMPRETLPVDFSNIKTRE